VKHIREAGAMKAALSTEVLDERELARLAREGPGLVGRDLVQEVAATESYDWTEPLPEGAPADGPRYDVVVMDYGLKWNILRLLVSHGCRVRVMPAYATAEEVLALSPDGVMLSNGPGDPAALPGIVAEVRKMLGRVPVFGICLGHQVLGQAMGGATSKLKFGHHGSNQPVMHLADRHVEITSQNHGFVVDLDSLPKGSVEVTHVNLNDGTVEGLRCLDVPALSVQYHPESAPGPHDSRYLFETFTRQMAEHKA
jgi:carbamoyl-phosphate synthase small subunit